MANQLKEWTAAQRNAGRNVADRWQKFFQAERKDAIERVEEINETARITEVQDKHVAALMALENVVLLPHIGSATVSTRNRMAQTAAANVVSVLRGEGPLNPVGV